MSENLIEKFVDNDSLKALKNLIESTSDNAALSSSVQLADIFDAGQTFKEIVVVKIFRFFFSCELFDSNICGSCKCYKSSNYADNFNKFFKFHG